MMIALPAFYRRLGQGLIYIFAFFLVAKLATAAFRLLVIDPSPSPYSNLILGHIFTNRKTRIRNMFIL
jgi:hypothetical protein